MANCDGPCRAGALLAVLSGPGPRVEAPEMQASCLAGTGRPAECSLGRRPGGTIFLLSLRLAPDGRCHQFVSFILTVGFIERVEISSVSEILKIHL